jgi:hypothetical protein
MLGIGDSVTDGFGPSPEPFGRWVRMYTAPPALQSGIYLRFTPKGDGVEMGSEGSALPALFF